MTKSEKLEKLELYLNKRYDYLDKILKDEGDLVCTYCGRKNLDIGHREIKYSKLDSRNKNLATIDHIVPRSLNLIDPMDEDNWCVSCKKCNQKKADKPLKDVKF